jgi:hypothetical protein
MGTASETERKDALSDQDMERLHADDLQAGRIVVGLITGVFAIGLLLYAFIWCVVWAG